MIGSYNGPTPEECSAEIQAAEHLRNSATDINRYISEYFELWNTLPNVPKVKSWKWEGRAPHLDLRVRNSHSCPEGEVRNFAGDANKPTSYAAVTGRLQVIYQETGSDGSCGLPTKDSRSTIPRIYYYSGTGNSCIDDEGCRGYSSHVVFWLQDFPKMWEAYLGISDKSALESITLEGLAAVLGNIEELPRHLSGSDPRVLEVVKQRLGEL
jgi:hypothetical protein